MRFVLGRPLTSAAVLLLAGGLALAPAAAWAAPLPDSGPVAGGTVVTLELPPAPTGFAEVAPGQSASFGIGNDGYLYGWGTPYGPVPTRIATPAGVRFSKLHSAFGTQTFAFGDDGNWYAWGLNYAGQLGDGTTTDRATPVVVDVPSGVIFTSIDSSGITTYALDSLGNVYAWGSGGNGEFGDGTMDWTPRTTPGLVPSPTADPFVQVSAGRQYAVALTATGDVYSWGMAYSDSAGALGLGHLLGSAVPALVALPSGVEVASVVAARDEGNFSLALTTSGELYSWGINWFGQLALGAADYVAHPIPTLVTLPSGITFSEVNTLYRGAVALDQNGNGWAWGQNGAGELGDGNGFVSPGYSAVPVPVLMPSGVTFESITTGWNGTFGLDSAGNAYGWGGNYGTPGPLGTGTTGLVLSPQPVAAPPVQPVVLTKVTFGGVDADSATFVDLGNGSWTVVTPAHVAGPFDVTVEYTLGGIAQEPLVFTSGFTFLEAPALTDPVDRAVACDASVSFSTQVTAGYPVPTVTWEQSSDGGVTWVALGSAATVSADGLTVTVSATSALDGYQYRATAVNSEGSAVSAPAVLSVMCDIGTVDEAPALTDPVDRAVACDASVSFSTQVTAGYPVPTVTWEQSSDGGVTWVALGSAATVSADGLTVTVSATSALDGYQYRATAVNSEGSAVSAPATLTVTCSTGTDDTDVNSGNDRAGLASTGAGLPIGLGVLGLIMLMLGVAALALGARRARS